MATFNEDVTISGNLTVSGSPTFGGGMQRTQSRLETDLEYEVPFTSFRVHDAYQTLLGTGSSDDLGFTTPAFNSGTPYLSTGDLNVAGSITRYARAYFQIPYQFVGGQDFYLRIVAGMITSVASVAATVDAELRVSNGQTGLSGSDLVTTSAQSMNSLSFATLNFLCTGSGRERGEVLDLRIVVAANSATASAHFGAITRVAFLWPSKS